MFVVMLLPLVSTECRLDDPCLPRSKLKCTRKVQFAYFIGSIAAEKMMNLKSSQRFRGRSCLKNIRHASVVPALWPESVKERPFAPASPGFWLRQNGSDRLGRGKLARFLLFLVRLPGEPENHPSVAHEWRETEERAP
jgi:hypothetical protein